uniref:RNA polymerase sigma-70 factor n=1 Tax=uncultured Dysgonomonas sp. TaxID=206096 RepID=UPI002639BB31|nr:RNA polymerase sigma-70 factor [uncultured Dysgonomonas sp.]
MDNQLTDTVIESLQKGSHKAFETIFLKYFPKVKYYINGFVKSADVAEGLTQNVFLKIWENHESFSITSRGVKGFDSYIYTIAYRQTIDYIRSRQVRESFYNDQMALYPDLVDTEDEYIAEETMLLIEMEIENMPEKQRVIYKLSRHEGISNDKIAERLDLSKRTVENQLSLAMKRIKNVLSFFI